MGKKLAAVVAAVVLLLGFSATPTQAAWNACPDYHFCMWEHTNYWGTTFFASNPAHNICYWAMEGTSSIRNRLRHHVMIYNNTSCTGGFNVWPGQSFSPPTGYDGFIKFKVIG